VTVPVYFNTGQCIRLFHQYSTRFGYGTIINSIIINFILRSKLDNDCRLDVRVKIRPRFIRNFRLERFDNYDNSGLLRTRPGHYIYVFITSKHVSKIHMVLDHLTVRLKFSNTVTYTLKKPTNMLHMSGNDTILVKYYYYTIFKLSNNVLSLKQYKRIC